MVEDVTSFGGLDCARRALVERHLKLVRLHLARRVSLPRQARRSREAEDLFQEGCVGLIRAAMKHDPRRHGPFEPFALARIRGAVHRAIYEKFATVHVPVGAAKRDGGLPGDPGVGGARPMRRIDLDLSSCPAGCRGRRDDEGDDAAPADASDAVGRHLRDKHRIALAVAVDRVEAQCRRRDVRPVLRALAEERLAILHEDGRTPLREIARRFGASTGRVTAWQRALDSEVRKMLASDPEFGVLREVHRSCLAGEAVREEALEKALTAARSRAMRQAFIGCDEDGQARLMLMVMRRGKADPAAEVAEIFGRLEECVQREILAELHEARGGVSGGESFMHPPGVRMQACRTARRGIRR